MSKNEQSSNGVIVVEIRPFGRIAFKIWPALISVPFSKSKPDKRIVFAEVQDNPLCPLVSATADDAREFARALLAAANSADHAAEGIGAGS